MKGEHVKTIQLGTRAVVGEGYPCYIIAEGGINSNGDPAIAKKLIDAAAAAGADAIKWQMRDVETVYGRPPYAPGYLDQPRAHDLSADQTQRGQKTALEFPLHVHEHLAMYARERGLDYTVSAWDEKSLAAALTLNPPWLKLASPCILDRGLVWAHAATGLPLVISTGATSLEQVEDVLRLSIYRQARTRRNVDSVPSTAAAPSPARPDVAVALLHCCSSYPSAEEDLNLRAIETMRNHFGVPIGYSGHERGIATTVAAVALGACIVERHLTLDRTMYGSDQSASLEPHGFARMVRDIRAVERAMGDGVKRMQPSEEAAATKMRRVVD